VSYFQVFARFAPLRDFPWVNLPVIWMGVVLTAVGYVRAVRRERGKILGSVAVLLSVLLTGVFHTYVFWYTYRMPEAAAAPTAAIPAPDFTLVDQHGNPVTLSDFHGRNVVLVFYRGHW
jgi:hypothetical protein